MTQRKASPETMARLCEAVDGDSFFTHSPEVDKALAAYRAETTPPLRSRAEVDAEIVRVFRRYMLTDSGELTTVGTSDDALWAYLEALVSEPTAPDPAPSAEVKRECQDCGLLYSGPECPAHFDSNPLTDHDHDTREERPCGCEEAEALKDQNTELCRLLGHVHGTIAGLVKVLGDSLP